MTDQVNRDAELRGKSKRAISEKPIKGKKKFSGWVLKSKTFRQLKILVSYLPSERIKGLVALLLLSVTLGIVDLVFVGMLARLVGALSGSKLDDRIPQIVVFGGDRVDQGIWVAGLAIGLVWLSMLMRYATAWIQSMISAQIWADYGEKIYANILLQPYEYFQNQNSAHLLARLNRILNKISDDLVLPMLTVASNGLTVSVLTLGTVIAFGLPALAIFGFMFGAYSLASYVVVKPLRFASEQKLSFALRVSSLLMESTRSIRDVQLYSAETFYIRKFEKIGKKGKRYDRISKLLPEIPRFIIEPAGITFLFIVALLPGLLQGSSGFRVEDTIPTLTAVMFATLKLSSPFQAIFRAINKLRGGLPDINDAIQLLKLKPARRLLHSEGVMTPEGVMARSSVRLDKVWYRYPESQDWVLRDVSISVPVGSRIALVGATGGGKTTAAHVLLSLLSPQRGRLLIDGIQLEETEQPAWQACCSIVPQNISLLDASIRSNIAFGVNESMIDDEMIWNALEMAQLAEFVAELPYGVYTLVGDDGMRLSGGQRQRLALARAFYKRSQVLVLDEATSSLDNKTESDVLEALELVGRRCTTLVIAHRLSTIRYCDRIYEFEKGRIKAHGNYDDLQQRSDTFRTLVELQDG